MTLIASQVLSSKTTNVTFSSIPQTYTDLKLLLSAQNDDGGAYTDLLFVQLNSDTTSNYSETRIYGFSTTAGSSRTSSSGFLAPRIDSAGGTANVFSCTEFYIPNYTSTSTKQIWSFGVAEQNDTSNAYITADAELYRGTSAITSISLAVNGAYNFSINSSFYLYGIKNS